MNLPRKELRILVNVCAVLFVLGLLALAFYLGGCAHIRKGAEPPRTPTAIEQVLVWNAALADANLAVAKGVIAASDANEIDVPTANRILTAQSLIADADRQLTPILAKACSPQKQIQACNPAILSGDSAAISGFLDRIKLSASNLVKDGTAGIKNPARAKAVAQSIETIYTLADQIVDALKSLGVLKSGRGKGENYDERAGEYLEAGELARGFYRAHARAGVEIQAFA